MVVAAEVERGERRDRAGHADRGARLQRREQVAHLAGRRGQRARARVDPSAGDARSAARSRRRCCVRSLVVVSSVEPPPTSSTSVPSSSGAAGGDPAKVSSRLLVAREQPRREAVAPLDLAEERLAVLGVADGAGRDVSTRSAPSSLRLAAVVGEHVADARDRERAAAAALVDAFAEPRDLALACDLLDARRRRRRRRAAGSSWCPGRRLRRASSKASSAIMRPRRGVEQSGSSPGS